MKKSTKNILITAGIAAGGLAVAVAKKKKAPGEEKTKKENIPHKQGFYEKYIKRPQESLLSTCQELSS